MDLNTIANGVKIIGIWQNINNTYEIVKIQFHRCYFRKKWRLKYQRSILTISVEPLNIGLVFT